MYPFLDFLKEFLSAEELFGFAEWAFGEKRGTLEKNLEYMHAWNKLHGEALLLKDSGILGEDVPKMIQLWRDSQK